MSGFVVSFLVGLAVGAMMGIFLIAMVSANRDDDNSKFS